MPSARTSFPHKVTFTVTGVKTLTYLFEGHSSTHNKSQTRKHLIGFIGFSNMKVTDDFDKSNYKYYIKNHQCDMTIKINNAP